MTREFERRRLRVYVAGPISQGDFFDNITAGIRVGRQMVLDGLAPYVPHLDAYMLVHADRDDSPTWNAFLEWDLEWVAQADALYRLSGPSKGADLECDTARSLDIPVFSEDAYGVPRSHPDSAYSQLLRFARDAGLTGERS